MVTTPTLLRVAHCRYALVLCTALAACDRGATLRDAGADADATRDVPVAPGPDAPHDVLALPDVRDVDAATDGPDAPAQLDATSPDAMADATDDAGPDGGDGADVAMSPLFVDAGCGATYASYEPVPGVHFPPDAVIPWSTNPPSSGDHYYFWARWGIHTERVPRGYWVHNLEHGGVALLYRCGPTDDCATTRAQLAAFVASLEQDPACPVVDGGPSRRIVLTEDPDIATPVAAAAWGWTYGALCVDTPSLRTFVLARTGHAPEDSCFEGSYP